MGVGEVEEEVEVEVEVEVAGEVVFLLPLMCSSRRDSLERNLEGMTPRNVHRRWQQLYLAASKAVMIYRGSVASQEVHQAWVRRTG